MRKYWWLFVVIGILVFFVAWGMYNTTESQNSYMELLQTYEARETSAVSRTEQEYMGVISDILAEEQKLLGLELTTEEKNMLEESYSEFLGSPDLRKARHHLGTMEYIVVQHNTKP